MNTLAERLLYAINRKSYTQEQLAQKANTTQVTISNILRGETLKPRNIVEIAKALDVDPLWLQTGAGEMQPHVSVEWLDPNKTYDNDDYMEIELYDIKLSAGTGKPVVEWLPQPTAEPILLPRMWFKSKRINAECCKGMLVKGQSMMPVLNDEDVVIIDISDQDIIDGEIYALAYRGNFYIKQVFRMGKDIALESYNPTFRPIEIGGEDLQHLQIIGRKVWRGG